MYYLDMYFPTEQDIPDFGSIRLTGVGGKTPQEKRKDSFGLPIDVRLRRYILLSEDAEKLSLINNAAEGSVGMAVDTRDSYILCEGQWHKTSRSGGGSDADGYEWEDI